MPSTYSNQIHPFPAYIHSLKLTKSPCENRRFAPKGNKNTFQPSMDPGAKMLVSGRVLVLATLVFCCLLWMIIQVQVAKHNSLGRSDTRHPAATRQHLVASNVVV